MQSRACSSCPCPYTALPISSCCPARVRCSRPATAWQTDGSRTGPHGWGAYWAPALCQSILEVSDHAQGSGEQMGTGAALGVSGGLAEEAARAGRSWAPRVGWQMPWVGLCPNSSKRSGASVWRPASLGSSNAPEESALRKSGKTIAIVLCLYSLPSPDVAAEGAALGALRVGRASAAAAAPAPVAR